MFPIAAPLMDEAPSGEDLVARAQLGDLQAFEGLCRQVEPRLLRQAIVWCGNESLAGELVQETLVEAWKCLHRYNGHCQFFTWVCAILHHRNLSYLRRNRLCSLFSASSADPDEAQRILQRQPDLTAGPDEAVTNREQAEMIRRCIARLPPKQQQVILLRFFVDNSIEGIAAALRCSTGTVKSRLFHALENLRRMRCLNQLDQLPPESPAL
jgi:RNA polymerase sigma-70 factor (ECF subfamily)